jgi:hypothetical protein
MIHYLQHGIAPCMGPLTGLPKDWPQGHFWSGRWDDVDCDTCLERKDAHEPTCMPSKKVNAPFNKQQVMALQKWQRCEWVHPFTCCNRHMRPFRKGFTCQKCKRCQPWCHDFMLSPVPRRLFVPHPHEPLK